MKGGLLLALALSGCVIPDAVDEEPDNAVPVARVVVPQLVRVGDAAVIDATDSSDDDEDDLEFILVVSDGFELVDAVGSFEHVFAASGRYDVSVEARDHVDADVVFANVVVVDGDVEACDCDVGCLDDGVCVVDACVLLASTDERLPAVDALTCE